LKTGGKVHRRKAAHPGRFFGTGWFLFLGVLIAGTSTVGLTLRFHLHWLVGYLISLNAVSFVLYGYDKAASRAGILRVPERTLHLFDLAGGTPGAFVARHLFHHKTVKTSFRVVFWLLASVQAALLAWALWKL